MYSICNRSVGLKVRSLVTCALGMILSGTSDLFLSVTDESCVELGTRLLDSSGLPGIVVPAPFATETSSVDLDPPLPRPLVGPDRVGWLEALPFFLSKHGRVWKLRERGIDRGRAQLLKASRSSSSSIFGSTITATNAKVGRDPDGFESSCFTRAT